MLYTIIVFSENKPGVLYRIADLFLRRRINIESMTVSEIEEQKMSRFTITVDADGALVEKIVKQIYRIIEVLKVIESTDSELIVREVALYKVHVSSAEKQAQIHEIITMTKSSITHFSKGEVTITHTGTEEETENLKSLLQPFGLKEFVRSGRIAVTKKEHALSGKWALEMDK